MWPPGMALASGSCGWTGRIGGLVLKQGRDGPSLADGLGSGSVRPGAIPRRGLGMFVETD
jgi:hypothetical protein